MMWQSIKCVEAQSQLLARVVKILQNTDIFNNRFSCSTHIIWTFNYKQWVNNEHYDHKILKTGLTK